jgi:hypothetical protein
MKEKESYLQYILTYTGAALGNWVAWFDQNGETLVKFFAVCASLAAVVLAILTAIEKRQRFLYYKQAKKLLKEEQKVVIKHPNITIDEYLKHD